MYDTARRLKIPFIAGSSVPVTWREPPIDLPLGSEIEEAMVIAFHPEHEFSKLDAVPLREIAKQRYVERLHCEFREEVVQFYKELDLELDIAFRSQREDWIQSLVRDGMGICCIPRYSLLGLDIDHRPIIDPVLSRKVEFVIADQAERTPALSMLIELASKHDWPEYEPPVMSSG